MRTSDKVAAQFNDNDRRDPLHDRIVIWTQENAGCIYEEINNKYYKNNGVEQLHLWSENRITCIWEAPLTRGRGSVGGYVDLMIVGSPVFRYQNIACEIKPRIDSLGDVIRQIQYYRTLDYSLSRVEYCVVSPDDRYAKLLEDQGIHFIKYTP